MKHLKLVQLALTCALVVVSLFTARANAEGKTRTCFIAVDEIDWDYTPMGKDQMMGMAPDKNAKMYFESDKHQIGRVYHNALYRQYTDATFSKLKPRTPEWEHLGLLGPALHAEVGDTIQILFKNNGTESYSMHPHGVFYEKSSEGSYYNDGANDPTHNGIVAPGATHTYIWKVPERAGPGPNDPSSIVWLYHSHNFEGHDTNAGLIGTIIITKKGMARTDGTPKDVDREFSIVGSGFIAANIRLTINGYLYGNMPMMTMHKDDHVRWYLVSLGNGFNFHTPHWHGNVVTVNGSRTDVVLLSPAQMVTADMVPDNVGTWMYHCHITDHMEAGMMAMYQVLPYQEYSYLCLKLTYIPLAFPHQPR